MFVKPEICVVRCRNVDWDQVNYDYVDSSITEQLVSSSIGNLLIFLTIFFFKKAIIFFT